MASTEPLTGVTVQDQNDAATGGTQIGNLAKAIASYTTPRYSTTSARDAAYSSWVSAGHSMTAGLKCTVNGKAMIYTGSAWVYETSDASWTTLSIASGWFQPYTESGTYVPNPGYRREGDRVWLRGYVQTIAAGTGGLSTVGAIPSSLLPAYDYPLWANKELANPVRLYVRISDGTIMAYRTFSSGEYWDLDGLSWPIG